MILGSWGVFKFKAFFWCAVITESLVPFVEGIRSSWCWRVSEKDKKWRTHHNRLFPIPRASVSKRGWVVSLWYDNDFSFSCKESHFHKNGCALALILKVRVFGTRKWPIFIGTQSSSDSWILDSTQWIPDCSTVKIGFWIPIASKILYSLSWITDSKARESEFHEQKFPGSRIPQAKIAQIAESGLP